MADNTIDTLSIQITSSSAGATKAINALCSNLQKLNGQLENYSSDSGKYGQALKNLEVGLNGLNSAINGIKADNLKTVASSVNSLANSASKLKNAFGNIGLDKASSDARALDAEMNKAVKNIMSYFGSSNAAAKQIKNAFSDFVNSSKLGDNFTIPDEGKLENLQKVLENNVSPSKMGLYDGVMDEYQKIVDYIRNTSIPVQLSFDWKDVAGDFQSFQKMAGTLGVGKFTLGSGKNGGISEYVSEMNGALGTNLDTSSDANAFLALHDAVAEARSELNNFSSATTRVEIPITEVFQAVEQATRSLLTLKGEMASTSSQMSSAGSSLASNPFVDLANGLKSLPTTVPDLSGISGIAENIAKLGYKAASQGIANLPMLANGLRSLSGLTSLPDFSNTEGLAKLIVAFNMLGRKTGTNASANIKPMVDGLMELSNLSGLTFPDSSGLMSLANAFSALGRATTEKAIQNIPQLATAFKNLMQTLSNAPRVSNNVISLANAMAKLASNGAKVGTTARSFNTGMQRMSSGLDGVLSRSKSLSSKMTQLAGSIQFPGKGFLTIGKNALLFGKNLLISGRNADSTGSKYSTLASKIGLLYAKFWVLLRAVRALNRMISVASHLTEVQNVVDTTFGNMSYKIENFSKNAIKSFGMSELSAKTFASQFQAMGTAMGITGAQVQKAQELINTKKTADGLTAGYNKASNSMADMSINLTKLAADMASFYDIEQETVAKALQSGVLAGQTRPLILAA